MSAIETLLSRCNEYLAPPMNFKGPNAIAEDKIYAALDKLFMCLNNDTSVKGFTTWIMLPLAVAMGEDNAFSVEGKALFSESNLANRVEFSRKIFAESKRLYYENSVVLDEDLWDFAKYANTDIVSVAKAFMTALKYKKSSQ